jgi:hypothetical protein
MSMSIMVSKEEEVENWKAGLSDLQLEKVIRKWYAESL